jgi:hypothetical protein
MNIDEGNQEIHLSPSEAQLLKTGDTFPFKDAPALLERIKMAVQSLAENPPSTSSPVFAERSSAFRAHAVSLDLLSVMGEKVLPVAVMQIDIEQGHTDVEDFLRGQD